MDSERRQMVLKRVISISRKHHQNKKMTRKELYNEITRRQQQKLKQKQQKQDQADRNALERRIKEKGINAIDFCHFIDISQDTVMDILQGDITGEEIMHYWSVDTDRQLLHGTVLWLMAEPKGKYRIQYWKLGQNTQESTKNYISKFALVVGLLLGDSVISWDDDIDFHVEFLILLFMNNLTDFQNFSSTIMHCNDY